MASSAKAGRAPALLQYVRRTTAALVALADAKAALGELRGADQAKRRDSAKLAARMARLAKSLEHLRRAEAAVRAACAAMGDLPEANYSKTRDKSDPLWRCVFPDCGSLEWGHRRKIHMMVFHEVDVSEGQLHHYFSPADQPPEITEEDDEP